MTDPAAPRDPQTPSEPPDAAPPGAEAPPPPGYGSAPAGQPSYGGQPGGQPANAPFSPLVGRQLTSDETMWSMLGHLGGIVIGFIAPLIVMLTKGNESAYTRHHAVEALNFQIVVAIAYVIAIATTFILIGVLLLPVIIIGNIIFCIMAGLAANKGEAYRYPVTIRMVK